MIRARFPKMEGSLESFIRICHRLYEKGLVCAYDGNVSMRFGEYILITPTHLCKGDVTIDDLIVIDKEGKTVFGGRRPSSEAKMHLAVYEASSSLQCVVHAHPLYATAIYRGQREVHPEILMEARMSLGAVPVIPYIETGTRELAEAVGRAVQHGAHVCMLEKHGAVACGEKLEETYFLIESLERLAKTEYIVGNTNF